MEGLYSTKPGGPYWYRGGVNPVGFISLAIGMLAFFIVFDPIAYEPKEGFDFLGASLPSAIVAGLVYYGGSKISRSTRVSLTPTTERD